MKADESKDLNVPLNISPISLRAANEFVAEHHRHSKPVQGAKFAVACLSAGEIVGVAIAGRPVARGLDDGLTLEITRCCTDGTRNACSKLYAAVRRIAQAFQYKSLITYTLESEAGASLSAVGAIKAAQVKGRQWSCPSRPREQVNAQNKVRWELMSKPALKHRPSPCAQCPNVGHKTCCCEGC